MFNRSIGVALSALAAAVLVSACGGGGGGGGAGREPRSTTPSSASALHASAADSVVKVRLTMTPLLRTRPR